MFRFLRGLHPVSWHRMADQLIVGRRTTNSGHQFSQSQSKLVRSFSSAATDSDPRKLSLETAPLHGIRVLDLTRVLAGPLCTMVLGDMGADILKIEKPGGGDETRNWGPPFVGTESCYFLAVNRNKKSVAVDISVPEGSAIVQELSKHCDVFIENFLPGKLDSYELGYETLQKHNPKLVYCSISGYGNDGPYKHRGGYDVIASALGGMMHITGSEGGDPCKIGTAMTDISTGLYAHGAILAALLRRQRLGIGMKIECNLLSTQVANLVNLGANFLYTGKEPKRWGTAHESIVPYQAFRTEDGQHFVVGAGSDGQFSSLCELMGIAFHQDARFMKNATRVTHRVELIRLLSAEFSKRSLSDWLEVFKDAKFPYGPVNTFAQVFSDPQVRHNGMVFEMVHQKAGQVTMIRYPVNLSESNTEPRLPPPMLGEHTDQLLRDILQYDEKLLLKLRNKNVIA